MCVTEYLAMSIGDRLDYRNVDQVVRGRDRVVLEWDQSGFILICAMTDMTEVESQNLSQNKVRVSAMIEGEFILPVWRFAGSQVYGETPFDPTVYRPYVPGSREQILDSRIVTIVGVDSETMVVRALRAANLPPRFIRATQDAWKTAWDDPTYSKRYASWIGTMMCYSTEELIERAEYTGSLGDSPMGSP